MATYLFVALVTNSLIYICIFYYYYILILYLLIFYTSVLVDNYIYLFYYHLKRIKDIPIDIVLTLLKPYWERYNACSKFHLV